MATQSFGGLWWTKAGEEWLKKQNEESWKEAGQAGPVRTVVEGSAGLPAGPLLCQDDDLNQPLQAEEAQPKSEGPSWRRRGRRNTEKKATMVLRFEKVREG